MLIDGKKAAILALILSMTDVCDIPVDVGVVRNSPPEPDMRVDAYAMPKPKRTHPLNPGHMKGKRGRK